MIRQSDFFAAVDQTIIRIKRDDQAIKAGIIAGQSRSGSFLGMAPDARIVSIKVADAHGSTDVSQVIAAIDWVAREEFDYTCLELAEGKPFSEILGLSYRNADGSLAHNAPRPMIEDMDALLDKDMLLQLVADHLGTSVVELDEAAMTPEVIEAASQMMPRHLVLFVVITEDVAYRFNLGNPGEAQTLDTWRRELSAIRGFDPIVIGQTNGVSPFLQETESVSEIINEPAHPLGVS